MIGDVWVPASDVFVVDGEASLVINPLANASVIWCQKWLKNESAPADVYWKYNGSDMTDPMQGFRMPTQPEILRLPYHKLDEFFFHFWVDNGAKLAYQFMRCSRFC